MRGLFSRFVEWASRTFGTFIERMVAVGVIQSGIVLAAQAFMALVPMVMAVTAMFPPRFSAAVTGWLRDKVGLSGSTEDLLQDLVGSRDALRGGITVIGVVLLLASATAFTRALQRVYQHAWGLPRVRSRGRGLMWLVGLVTYMVVVGLGVRFAGSGTAGTLLRAILAIGGAVLLWWWTPYVLLLGRVRMRALLPGGLLTAAALLVLGQVSSIVVPRTVRSSESQYGAIGVVFAFESWLVVVSCTIVLTAVIGAVMAQTDSPIGRWARGTTDPDGWRRAEPPDTT